MVYKKRLLNLGKCSKMFDKVLILKDKIFYISGVLIVCKAV